MYSTKNIYAHRLQFTPVTSLRVVLKINYLKKFSKFSLKAFMTKAFYSELKGFKPQIFSRKEIQWRFFSGNSRKIFQNKCHCVKYQNFT